MEKRTASTKEFPAEVVRLALAEISNTHNLKPRRMAKASTFAATPGEVEPRLHASEALLQFSWQ